MTRFSSVEEMAAEVVGKKVTAVRIAEEVLQLNFADGSSVAFDVEGDCCSHSYFYDFHGVEKLLENGPVTEFSEIDLKDTEYVYAYDTGGFEDGYESVQVYGYRLVTEHPTWGEQTSAFSFRNSSNGYYGGWMGLTERRIDDVAPVTETVSEVVVTS